MGGRKGKTQQGGRKKEEKKVSQNGCRSGLGKRGKLKECYYYRKNARGTEVSAEIGFYKKNVSVG